MPNASPDNSPKTPLKNLARILIGAGLPALGTMVAGPMGGIVAASVADKLNAGKGNDFSDVGAIIAGATPGDLVKLRELETSLSLAQLETDRAEMGELTARHSIDATSDSWLARNVRPLSLAFTLVGYMLFIWFSTFLLIGQSAETAVEFGGQLQGLLWTIVGFYFGSRGIEKIKGVRA